MGCDWLDGRRRRADVISIHAPQWGATREQCAVVLDQVISIHAPQWGATRFPPCPTRNPEYFNPRTPVGCDATPRALEPNAFLFQSTHPSGVRLCGRTCRWSPDRHFNPRTPVGCDNIRRSGSSARCRFQSTHPSGVRRSPVCSNQYSTSFQSTHPSGVRPAHCSRRHRESNFNPRTPVGCDPVLTRAPCEWRDFNPRTPVGCDLVSVIRLFDIIRFQSTHPSGVRREESYYRGLVRRISIHAPQWGATRWRYPAASRPVHFNPRTPVGCDPSLSHDLPPVGISIHAPQWGATMLSEPPPARPSYFNPRTPVGCDLRPDL